jgi:hypothetical protein
MFSEFWFLQLFAYYRVFLLDQRTGDWSGAHQSALGPRTQAGWLAHTYLVFVGPILFYR